LITGAIVGGAVGTPLLLLIILLLVMLACVIKRNGCSKKSEIVTEKNEAYGESRVTVIFDETQRMSMLKSPFHVNKEDDTIYAAVQ
jgi:hypothetical protein